MGPHKGPHCIGLQRSAGLYLCQCIILHKMVKSMHERLKDGFLSTHIRRNLDKLVRHAEKGITPGLRRCRRHREDADSADQCFHKPAEFLQKPVVTRVDIGKRHQAVEMGAGHAVDGIRRNHDPGNPQPFHSLPP